jgi:hypothetical protein
MTPEEIAEVEAARKRDEEYEKTRPFTEAEVSRMVIAQQINSLAVDDNTALRMVEFYPEWKAGTEYTEQAGRAVGYKVHRGGKLWRLRQEHTSQTGWEPENAASLWAQINETHTGTLDDPIPYDGNMALESGKHYIQDGVIYLCTRDTGNPVYNALTDLVGVYVEKIE